jgi:hypothetical protein
VLLDCVQPAALQRLLGNARQLRFDVEHRRAVEHVDAANARRVDEVAEYLTERRKKAVQKTKGAA